MTARHPVGLNPPDTTHPTPRKEHPMTAGTQWG